MNLLRKHYDANVYNTTTPKNILNAHQGRTTNSSLMKALSRETVGYSQSRLVGHGESREREIVHLLKRRNARSLATNSKTQQSTGDRT